MKKTLLKAWAVVLPFAVPILYFAIGLLFGLINNARLAGLSN